MNATFHHLAAQKIVFANRKLDLCLLRENEMGLR